MTPKHITCFGIISTNSTNNNGWDKYLSYLWKFSKESIFPKFRWKQVTRALLNLWYFRHIRCLFTASFTHFELRHCHFWNLSSFPPVRCFTTLARYLYYYLMSYQLSPHMYSPDNELPASNSLKSEEIDKHQFIF